MELRIFPRPFPLAGGLLCDDHATTTGLRPPSRRIAGGVLGTPQAVVGGGCETLQPPSSCSRWASVASAGQPRLPPKHLPLHAQRPMSRVAIPTPLPLLAAPEPHPCVSRACAFWQVGHFFARSGAEDHPPNRLRLAADPQRARRRLPLDHIHSPPLSNLPQPPIHPSTPPPTLQSTLPQHLSRIPPPTAHPPCARSCKFYLVW